MLCMYVYDVCVYVCVPYRLRRLLRTRVGCPAGRTSLAGGEPDAALPYIAPLLLEDFPNFANI